VSPRKNPPPHYDGKPKKFSLPPGTQCTRIHSAEFNVADFNPTVVRDPLRGGRFDATPGDPYAFLYAGTGDEDPPARTWTAAADQVAVSEALLRDRTFTDTGAALLPRAALRGRRIGWFRTTTELNLVDLRNGPDLAAVGQDTWLVQTTEYAMTRPWAVSIRQWAPWAAGFIWRSRLEYEGYAYIFFEDRCPQDCVEGATTNLPAPVKPGDQNLDSGAGQQYVREILARYRASIR